MANADIEKLKKMVSGFKSFAELQKSVSLEDVIRALHAQEYNRIYRKKRYLTNQELVSRARAAGLDKDINII